MQCLKIYIYVYELRGLDTDRKVRFVTLILQL